MKKFFLFTSFFLITIVQAAAQQSFDKAAVKSVMKRVADWQIANPNKGAEHDDLDWTHAALYMGMLDWAELAEREDNNDSYYQWLLRIGRRQSFPGRQMDVSCRLYCRRTAFYRPLLEIWQQEDDRPRHGTSQLGGRESG